MTPPNTVLPPPWSERIDRLRVGIQPRDAMGSAAPLGSLGLHLEDVPRPWRIPPSPAGLPDPSIGLPGASLSPTGRFAVKLTGREPAGQDRLTVRLVDPTRRLVPRRLSLPVPSLGEVLDADEAGTPLPRATRPVLYPGANYGVPAGWTVVRGRVRWPDGEPVQWARVRVTPAEPIIVVDDEGDESEVTPLLGRAHGDDRGEFLLVVGSLPPDALPGDDPDELELAVEVVARPRPDDDAPVASPAGSRDDPLWHLPVEVVGDLDDDDAVAAGTTTPAGYTAHVTETVTCRRGAATRPAVVFDLP